MCISDRLKQAIDELGISLSTAADKTGIPYRSFQNYVAGRPPKSDALKKIRTHLGVSLDWLICGEGPVFSPELHQVREPWHPYLSTPSEEEAEILRVLKMLPADVKHELLDAAKVKGKVHTLEAKMRDMQSQISEMVERKKKEQQAQSQQQNTDEKPKTDD